MNRRNFIKTTTMGSLGIVATPAIVSDMHWNTSGKNVNKIKIGQIGFCHEHAGAKMETLKTMSDIFEIVGVVDDRNSRAARAPKADNQKPYEGLKRMSEKELLSTPGLQMVVIETANTDLVPTALRCMKTGLAMHMDKPGGENIKLFRALLDGCRQRQMPFQMGYMYRTNPAIQFCQKAVRENWLGDIFEIQAGMSHNYGGEQYQQYLSNFKGGIMFNLGCHIIDFIISMMGRPGKVTPFLGSTLGAASGAKNNCLAVLEYPNAVTFLHACDLEVDGINNRRLKISGANGTIELSPLERFDGKPLEMKLNLRSGNKEYASGTHIINFGIQKDRYEGQFKELAKIIRGEIKNPYTYEHDYLTQEVLLAASGYTKW
jgi:predicted dehydrogenase